MTRVKGKDKHHNAIAFLPEDLGDFLLRTEASNDTNLVRLLTSYIRAVDVNGQLKAVKELSTWVKTSDGHLESAEGALVVEMMAMGYFKASSKSPLKRALSCALQCFASFDVTMGFVSREIITLVNWTNANMEQKHMVAFVEKVSSLLESFPLGEAMLIHNHAPVINLMANILVLMLDGILSPSDNKPSGSSVDVSSTMHDCVVLLRSFNKLLQKSTASIVCSRGDGSDCSCDLLTSLRIVLRSLLNVTRNETFLLDCRIAAGMGLPLVVKILYGPRAATIITEKIFPAFKPSATKTTYSDIDTDVLSLFPHARNEMDCGVLCILNGTLAMLETDDLLFDVGVNKLLLTDLIGSHFIDSMGRINDANTKLVLSRGLILLTAKAHCLLQTNMTKNGKLLAEKFHGERELSQSLVRYSWNHWEDPVDIVRHQARTVFENTIKCHLVAAKEDTANSAFIHKLLSALLEMCWTVKGKYGPLCCLLDHIQPSVIMRECQNIQSQSLGVLGEQTLANHVCEFYTKLSFKHWEELQLRDGDTTCMRYWQEIHITPIVNVLCNGTKSQKTHCMEYLLPSLLKCSPHILSYIVSQLGTVGANDCDRMGAQMTCLKLAKVQGLFKQIRPEGGAHELWNGVIETDLLKHALSHNIDRIRLDAFGLVCEHHKSTEPVDQEDLSLLMYFFQYNMSNQEPSFRQQMAATFKKLLVRIRDSGRAALRKHSDAIRRDKTDEAALSLAYYESTKEFLIWLMSYMFNFLYPGAGFPGRTMALCSICLVFEIMRSEGGLELDVLEWLQPCHIQTLLECLMDTFESNKSDAFTILSLIPMRFLYKEEEESRQLLNVALELASSTRPQDSTTAAYLLKFLVRIPSLHVFGRDALCTEAESSSQYASVRSSCVVSENFYVIVKYFVRSLRGQLATAEQSLLHAAATAPMYPTLHAIRYLLAEVNFRNVESSWSWRGLIRDVISVCLDIATVVSPGVTNSSPEGNIPADSVIGPGLAMEGVVTGINDLDLLKESAAKVSLMPEYLVVCCWRCIKEVSLLLGQLSMAAPVIHPSTPESDLDDAVGILTVNQIEVIGSYFNTQLLESRHRGAFELAYAGFVKIVSMLWKSSIPCLYALPKQWLEDIIGDIKSRDPESKLCSTRRSAGVPFFVQALVSSTNSAAGKQCFRWVMTELLSLAAPPVEEEPVEDTGRVHALNVLRSMYKDTRLGDDVFPFISSGIKVGVLGYGSQFWAIRNSSTLLFSALMNRIFGIKKGKDEQAKKNCLSGRVFFNRFPQLYPFLLSQLEEATEDMGSGGQYKLHPGLYPVLMILGRLFPSVVEGADPNICMSAFVPYLIRCASTPVYKTRMMAARALQPLLSADNACSVVNTLLSVWFHPTEQCSMSQNSLHGNLNQILFIVKVVSDLFEITQNELADILIPGVLQMSTVAGLCFSNQIVLSKIQVGLVHFQWAGLSEATNDKLKKLEDTFCLQAMDTLKTKRAETWQPGWSELCGTLTECLLGVLISKERPIEECLSVVLQSPLYEVRLNGLTQLSNLTSDKRVSKASLVSSVAQSQRIFSIVAPMMFEERHPECLEKVLEILPSLNDVSSVPWLGKPEYSRTLLIGTLNELLHHPRDEVRCNALILLGSIIPQVYSQIGECNSAGDSKSELAQFVDTLFQMSSIEETVDMRISCAQSLLLNSHLLRSEYLPVIGESIFHLWSVYMRLLQDDDCDVRCISATINGKLLQESGRNDEKDDPNVVNVLPQLAIEQAIHHFIATFSIVDYSLCVKQVICWITEDAQPDMDSEEEDVRLFDRGEMNTYKDDLTFVRTVCGSFRSLCSTSVKERSAHFMDEITSTLVADAEERVDAIEGPLVPRAPFVSKTQHVYQEFVSDTFRRMTALQLLCDLDVKTTSGERGDNNTRKRVDLLKTKIKSKFSLMSINTALSSIL